jgi:hypothetical protein
MQPYDPTDDEEVAPARKGILRKPAPKQVSEMSDEELAHFKEEGAHEQGFAETAEDALTQGRDQLNAGLGGDVKMGSLPISKFEMEAEKMVGLRPSAIEKAEMPATEKAIFNETRKFGNNATMQSSPGELSYGHNTRPITNQINDETARTINYKALGDVPEQMPMWKQRMIKEGTYKGKISKMMGSKE